MSGEPSTIKRDLAALEDTACAYVARLANGASEAERREIEAWIDADPHHAVAFARMEAAWEASERLRASPPAMEATAAAPPPENRPARRGVIGALAAACAVGGIATGAWLHARDQRLYRTGVGERRTVRLDDGSSVELNTASTIEVAMHAHRRDVRLVQGEALFEVAHDAARPFWVTAGQARFRAVGTAFNVRIRSQVVELTVTQGVVAVSAVGKPDQATAPHIAAGHGAVVDGGAIAATALADDTLRQRTAWQSGVLEFNGETLTQAVDELNRYQRRPIVIGDQRIADIRIGGRFQVNEADKFLTAVSSAFPVDVRRTDDGGVLLTARVEKSSDPG
ncbi:FecR family protein [Caulobacter sp. KR2-114]|uniref:FecR family protein n=1 Tax=Caulobacter sp. KR2-114 TaxID=3400912 RepID=UPI003C00C6A0